MNLSDNFENIAQSNVYGLFMMPVGVFHNPDHTEHKQLILDYIQTLDSETVTSARQSISHGILQLGPSNILDQPELSPVRETISQAILDINANAFAYDLQSPTITDSVLEVHQEGSFLAPHEYANCLYSGIYFINFDREQHSQLKFKRTIASPFYSIIQAPQTTQTAFNLLDTSVPYSEGDILIFPSNLSHGYESNTHANRITLSFNIPPF